jgi:hypothetical protein
MKRKKIIIDFEFTGLDNSYQKDNEIIQMKSINLFTGEKKILNFGSKKKSCAGAYLVHRIKNHALKKRMFSKEEFYEFMPKDIENYEILGFSVTQDKEMLKKYGVSINITDIQELAALSGFEKEMSLGGRSLETVYYIVTKKLPTIKNHGGLDELLLIRSIYKKIQKNDTQKYYYYMPWGHCAGMPIKDYVLSYRRQADGYRFNNTDLLSKSLDYFIYKTEESDFGY